MRCNNCGWDNPTSIAKCEKCNAPLEGSMVYRGQPETPTAGFVPKGTVKGCPECGYPLMPNDSTCPQCGNSASEGGKPSDEPIPPPVMSVMPTKPKPPFGGTIMGGNAGRKLVGFLASYSLDSNGLFFPLYEGRNYVGRDSTSDVHLEGDNGISGKHFSILYRAVDKKFKFRDEQSSYGTFINDQLMDEGELTNNDTIQIGSTHLIFIAIPLK